MVTSTPAKTYFWLQFSMHFDRDPGLDYGRLTLNSSRDATLLVLTSTSSFNGKQYPESFHERKALIPPNYRLTNANKYQVDLNPVYLPNHAGIQGNFYKITPFEVRTDKGGVRSDLGIHADPNTPGSHGCIVMSVDRFAEFEKWAKKLKSWGVEKVDLFVTIS